METVPKLDSLAEFGNRLGKALYGAAWSSKLQTMMRSRELSSKDGLFDPDDELIQLVRRQIIAGFTYGIGHAARWVGGTIPPQLTLLPDSVAERMLGPHWTIRREFWLEGGTDARIDWSRSIVKVPESHIKGYPIPEPVTSSPEPIELRLWVVEPVEGLKVLVEPFPMPSREMLQTYERYVTAQIREATAAAWRYLAIEAPPNKHGIITKIVDEMQRYLAAQPPPIGPDPNKHRDALEVIASKICEQWRGGSDQLEKPVFVNSTPTKVNSDHLLTPKSPNKQR